jgi:hypothetical protein
MVGIGRATNLLATLVGLGPVKKRAQIKTKAMARREGSSATFKGDAKSDARSVAFRYRLISVATISWEGPQAGRCGLRIRRDDVAAAALKPYTDFHGVGGGTAESAAVKPIRTPCMPLHLKA